MHGLVLAITLISLALIVLVAAVHLVRWVWFPKEEKRLLLERQDRDQEALRRGLAVRAIQGDLERDRSPFRRPG